MEIILTSTSDISEGDSPFIDYTFELYNNNVLTESPIADLYVVEYLKPEYDKTERIADTITQHRVFKHKYFEHSDEDQYKKLGVTKEQLETLIRNQK